MSVVEETLRREQGGSSVPTEPTGKRYEVLRERGFVGVVPRGSVLRDYSLRFGISRRSQTVYRLQFNLIHKQINDCKTE